MKPFDRRNCITCWRFWQMESGPALTLFIWGAILSILTSWGVLIHSDKELTWSMALRLMIGSALLNGPIGGGLSLFCHEVIKLNAGSCVFVSIGYGAGAVRLLDLRRVLMGVLGVMNGAAKSDDKVG